MWSDSHTPARFPPRFPTASQRRTSLVSGDKAALEGRTHLSGGAKLGALRKIVAHGDGVAGIQVELLLFAGLQLDAEPPDRLARDAVGQHVGPGWNVGELEVSVLVRPEHVALLLGRTVGPAHQKQLETLHRLRLGARLGEEGAAHQDGITHLTLRLGGAAGSCGEARQGTSAGEPRSRFDGLPRAGRCAGQYP